MFKTILVPVDGSDHATKAADLATDLARTYGAKLVLLHVTLQGEAPAQLRRLAEIEHFVEAAEVERPSVANLPAGLGAALRNQQESQQSQAIYQALGQQILDIAERAAKAGSVADVETRMVSGDPTDQIIKAAAETGADLVVMGSRGLGDLKGLLLGSVSHKVASLAACTCITVK
ncbi:MAG: universal stress protein [Kiloniellales bacterium]|nr:universal stress protein [Kiloniellales bacterium]